MVSLHFSKLARIFGGSALLIAGLLTPAWVSTAAPTAPSTLVATTRARTELKVFTTAASHSDSPIVVSVGGVLSEVFFYEGQRVTHGQLLAKVQLPNHGTEFVSSPAAGRITKTRFTPGATLPDKAVLATVEVADVK